MTERSRPTLPTQSRQSGDHSFSACRRVLTADGTLVIVGAHRRVLTRLLVGTLRRRLLKERIVFFLASVSKEDLLTLKELIETSRLTPVIDRTYPLSETVEAVRYAETQRVRGKVVITVS